MGELARLTRIAPGEWRLAGALFAMMLVAAAGSGAGATAADALLFARYGTDSLPVMYLVLGIVSFVCALGVSAAFATVRRDRVYPVGIAALAALLVALRVGVAGKNDLVYPAIWLGANVVLMLQGIVVWGVASWLCDARQARRLFPIANAAKIAGTVIGTAAVAPLLVLVRVEDLLLVWALALVATLAIILRLAGGAAVASPAPAGGSIVDELGMGFRVVRASRLLRLLAVGLVLFSVLFFALALPFTRAARAAMPREDDLASFLGLFNATTTGVAFLASAIVANRLYARVGVVNAILGLTFVYAAGFAALAVSDSFLVIVAARWIQLAWLAGIADAAYQALFTPLPAERRDQMRAFMEGVPGQAGIALAGALLLVGDRAFDARLVAVGGVVCALATAAVIWRVRAAYGDALVAALRAGRPEPFLEARNGYAGLQSDASAIAILRGGLAGGDAATRRVSAQILAQVGVDGGARDALLELALDDDLLVRAFALRGGARLDAVAFAAAARVSVDADDPEARIAALFVLERTGDAAAVSRLRAEATSVDAQARAAAARAIGAGALREAGDVLGRLAVDGDLLVRRAAVEALAVRDPARALALAARGLGQPVTADESLAALEALPGASAVPEVRSFFEAERDRAFRYASLVDAVPQDGDIAALLAAGLRRRASDAARRAVRASSILSGRTASAAVLDGLASDDTRVRASAVEGLEACVRSDLARTLLPIWEGPRPGRPLLDLRDDDDPWLRACGIALAAGGGDMANLLTLPLMERVLFLHRVPLFATLDPADLQQVARIATECAFGEGATLFRQGDSGDALYIVVDGSLRIEQDGREIARRGPGDVVGEMSIVNDAPRLATVVAVEATRALRIGRPDFDAILRDRPETAVGVIRVLAKRLAEATAAR